MGNAGWLTADIKQLTVSILSSPDNITVILLIPYNLLLDNTYHSLIKQFLTKTEDC